MKERGNIYAGWLGIQQNMEHSAPYVAQVLAADDAAVAVRKTWRRGLTGHHLDWSPGTTDNANEDIANSN